MREIIHEKALIVGATGSGGLGLIEILFAILILH